MTTTPHFALAQHPETGCWMTYIWHSKSGWNSVFLHAGAAPTRIDALNITRVMARAGRLDIFGPREALVATLDRLIAHERDMQAGDEAAVQTIVKMEGE